MPGFLDDLTRFLTRPLGATDANPNGWAAPIAESPVGQALGQILTNDQGGLRWLPDLTPTAANPLPSLTMPAPLVMASVLGHTMTMGRERARHPAPTTPAPSPDVQGWDFNGGTPTTNPGGPAAAIFGPESAGNVNARNPASSAAGLGQFLAGTWMDSDLRRRAGFGNVPDAQWAQMRTGPNSVAANIAMTNAYAARNTEQWTEHFGTAPNAGQVYGMHFLNGDGFIRLTDEAARNPTASAASMFPAAAHANPTIFYQGQGAQRRPRTVQEVEAEITRRGGGSSGGSGTANPFLAAQPTLLDPRAANTIPLPNPANYADISFGAPPQRGTPPPRPLGEQIDVPALTAQFERYAPHAPDLARQHRLEFNDILAGMASGALGVDPVTRGVGGMLLGAGAGAAGARARAERMNDAEQTAWEESMRQFGLDVTRVGVQAQEANRATRNANANLTYQDAYDATERAFNNAQDTFHTNLEQLQFNTGRRDTLTQRTEAAQTARAQARLGIYQSNVGTTNQAGQQQQELDLRRYLNDQQLALSGLDGIALQRQTMALATSEGLLAADHSPLTQNAFQGAAALVAGNAPGAVNAFAQELAMSGHVPDVVTEILHGFEVNHVPVPPSMQQINTELGAIINPPPGSPPLPAAERDARLQNIATRLADFMQQSPTGTYNVAQHYATQGLPMARLLVRRLRPHTSLGAAAGISGTVGG